MGKSGGFTLIELILVTVIIGILAGAVVMNVGGRVNDTQITRAQSDIQVYSGAVDLYALDHNDTYPKTLSELVNGSRKYVRDIKNDPWGNPYIYQAGTDPRKADYKIYSAGADGIPNTEDDVTSDTILERD